MTLIYYFMRAISYNRIFAAALFLTAVLLTGAAIYGIMYVSDIRQHLRHV